MHSGRSIKGGFCLFLVPDHKFSTSMSQPVSAMPHPKISGLFLRSLLLPVILLLFSIASGQESLELNDRGYFHMNGLDVTVFSDFYPDGHQSGVTIIQHGSRVAANGDLRLELSPGQWSPIPAGAPVRIDESTRTISKTLWYPDTARNRRGFNPIIYPDLQFRYRVQVSPAGGSSFRVRVDLEELLPGKWIGRVGFNLELFPGDLFGKTYLMDGRPGIFPTQPIGPMEDKEDLEDRKDGKSTASYSGHYTGPFRDPYSEPLTGAMDRGNELVIAPEDPARKMVITSAGSALELRDGRANHNNGWFIVRSAVPANATQGAVEWLITPGVMGDWKYVPVIQVSQLGYHPAQKKLAVIELDMQEKVLQEFILYRVEKNGKVPVMQGKPVPWGEFLRYRYATVDFSGVETPGVYELTYGETVSHPFLISDDVYRRNTWQATLEYFLPVQMCHMRVNEKYRVWHGLCHMDDARMALLDTILFDGYVQGPSTLTGFSPGEPVGGLNSGGWHDAGDYDLRVESQAGTVRMLAMMIEEFGLYHDATLIDPVNHIVEIHVPDGKSDVLQQIEHGLETILGGYRSMGRLYRGIICPTLRQYVMLGDAASMTDNRVYKPALTEGGTNASVSDQPDGGGTNASVSDQPDGGGTTAGGSGLTGGDRSIANGSGLPDDRWVFTEENPRRELIVAAALANSARVLWEYNPPLADESLSVALALWQNAKDKTSAVSPRVEALTELILTTGDGELLKELVSMKNRIIPEIDNCGWVLGRLIPLIKEPSSRNAKPVLRLYDRMLEIDDPSFLEDISAAVAAYQEKLEAQQAKDSPYGVPYRPRIWGAGWTIQQFGVEQYFFHRGWPEHTPTDHYENALNFILGVHPGVNNSSFVSGVGSESVTTAYGVNRADWSFIPGGVASGTALIRPDLPELKVWPFFWQQTEYVMGGGATNFMFLVLAVDALYNSSRQ